MKALNHILFIASNYPSIARPYSGVFIQQVVHEIASLGVTCSVISPTSYSESRWGELDPVFYLDKAVENNPIKVYKPRYLSFSNKKVLGVSLFKMTVYSFY